ncbi:hypothetical protein ACGFOM_38370 [Streptomyces sp. NPDC048594]|uniref:hypothetical protein n=1 Tax=Streptomyces sp. NPDC048594 TaxID=3365575 RepID=UPI00371DFDC7
MGEDLRPAEGAERNRVQLCIPAWNALDARDCDNKSAPRLPTMHPPTSPATWARTRNE